MPRLLHILLLSLLAVLPSCTESNFSAVIPTGGNTRKITVNLGVPGFTAVGVQSRSTEGLQNLDIFCYDASGQYLATQTIKADELSAEQDGSYKISLELPEEVSTLHFVHSSSPNALAAFDPSTDSITEVYTTWATQWPQQNPELMWAKANVNDLATASSPAVTLLRDHALVSVENLSGNEEFTIDGFGVYGTASGGYLSTDDPAKARVSTGEDYSFNFVNGSPDGSNLTMTDPVAVYESGKGHGRVIIKAHYKGSECYYAASFARYESTLSGDSKYSQLEILRNHHYRFRIKKVNGAGKSSIEEAYSSEPDNGMEIYIEVLNDEITDIIAANGVALGLSTNEMKVAGNVTSLEFLVVSNFKADEQPEPRLTAVADPDRGGDCTWIHTEKSTMQLEGTCYVGDADGYCYHVTVPLDAATSTTAGRTGYIKVAEGDLELTVTVEQEARSYTRERRIMVRIPKPDGSYYQIDDYLEWIKNDDGNGCRGLRPEQNRGANRYDFLIFPPVEGLYSNKIEYYVTRTDDDRAKNNNYTRVTAGFNLDEVNIDNQRYWKVTQSNINPGMVSYARLTIVTYDNYDVVYPLYCMGFFHELTDDMVKYQNGVSKKTGWFYYELFYSYRGTDGVLYYMLDRNIGASSNGTYLDGSSTYNDTDAIGAYFQIATERFSAPGNDASGYVNSRAILDRLNLGKNLFVPSVNDVEQMDFIPDTGKDNLQHIYITVAERTYTADGKIYFPHAGYYAGNMKRNAGRANFWLSTLYNESDWSDSGQSQAFDSKFGFWYYFFNGETIPGNNNPYGHIRCNNAQGADFSDATETVYMPLRLMAHDY